MFAVHYRVEAHDSYLGGDSSICFDMKCIESTLNVVLQMHLILLFILVSYGFMVPSTILLRSLVCETHLLLMLHQLLLDILHHVGPMYSSSMWLNQETHSFLTIRHTDISNIYMSGTYYYNDVFTCLHGIGLMVFSIFRKQQHFSIIYSHRGQYSLWTQ